MISVFLGRALYFTMKWTHCACSTFITAKITVLHQQIYPKRYCETRSLLFNPRTWLFSLHSSTTPLIRLYLDLLCKHTFLTHTVILQSLTAQVWRYEGASISKSRLLYSQQYKYAKIMLIYDCAFGSKTN